MDGFSQDLRHALRALIKYPGFSIVAVFTLGVAIGANTAIFSLVYGILLKPLPFDDPGRLVGLYHRAPAVGLGSMNQGPSTYFTYYDQNRVFDAMGAWESDEVSVTGLGEPEQVESLSVTSDLLPMLRVQPMLGRVFNKEDDAPGAPLRTMLTYAYWQRRFGASNAVVGQTVRIDGRPSEIIGVLPASFRFLRTDAAVVVPMQLQRPNDGGVTFDFQAIGRLRPGLGLGEANADVARMISLLPRTYSVLKLEPYVRPLADDISGGIRDVLWILLAAVGIVLLIACANVANLFLVRADARQQEFAMRAALGAGRGRIARGLLSESVLTGLAGGGFGVLVAQAGLAVLRRLAPADLPRLNDIALDPAVMGFALVLSMASGILFGVIPVLRFGSPNASALKQGGRGASDGPGRQRTRNALVVAEVGLAVTLLVVSGLMIRTFSAMRQVHPGFTQPEDVQTFRIAIPPSLVGDDQQFARMHEEIARRLQQLPGVVSVGVSSSITMDGEDNGNPLRAEGLEGPDGELPPLRRFKSVGPGYFETMGNRVVAGRPVTWTDVYKLRPVVVISENLAREYWKEPSRALGKRVRNGPGDTWHEIIGVVGNERDDGLNHPATAIVYWPLLNDTYQNRTMAYAVRSGRVKAPGFLREIQQTIWSVDASLPLAAVETLDEIRSRSMAQTSFVMVMLAIAGSVALVLGVVGLYGVIAYVITQRTREIATRIALGAQSEDVRRLFLRHGLTLAATGIALGIGASLVMTRVMSALLFGVGPLDPATYLSAAGILMAVAMLATYLPARRASRLDPMTALRSGG